MLSQVIEIAKECGSIIKNAQIQRVELKNQDRRNLVTEYDLKVQSILQERLQNLIPTASFMGEEGEQHYRKDGYCFVCDPIDGTTNFVQGCNFRAISIALLKDGKPVLGVIYNPYLDELFSAEKNKGAFLNGKPIHTTTDCLANSLVSFGTNVAEPKQTDILFEYSKKCFKSAIDVRSCGSAALNLCNIAGGCFGYFFEFKLFSWDFAAGALIVEEAGGIIKGKDFENIKDYFQTGPIFACANQKIFEEVRALYETTAKNQ